MKRIIIALILVVSTLLCLSSCDKTDIDIAREQLDTLAQKEYNHYTIEMTVDSPNGYKITEKYTVKIENGARTVDYRTEKINSFTINGDSISIPEEYMTVTEGTLVNEEVLPTDFSVPKFDFLNDTLRNCLVEDGGTRLTATILSTNNFMGKDLTADNANLEVSYSADTLNYVIVSYTSSSGNSITLKYIFE